MANAQHDSGIDLASRQKEISISEFFEKNKHFLGFDNPTKALLIVVKEAIDNSIDACEEAGILPELTVKIKSIGEDVYRVTVQDNGPGLPKESIKKTFGTFLYGSKFHRLVQRRGQQGIGITGSILYSQLTTGKPTKIWSKTKTGKTYFTKMMLNVTKNEAEIIEEGYASDSESIKEHGMRIEMDIEGRYRKTQSVDDYLIQTAIANPSVKITYTAPDNRKIVFSRAIDKLPKLPKEIKPHPYGVELGIFLRMLKNTNSKTIINFLTNEFSSIGATTANKVFKVVKLNPRTDPKKIENGMAEKLLKNMQSMEINRPPTDCLSPIGKDDFKNGLKKRFPNAEFIATETRSPEVYRGNPFQIETAIVYDPTEFKKDTIKLMRFSNKAPLLYQQSACAITRSVTGIDWKRYGLEQSKNALPSGPCVIAVHLCSVWVPFVSEGKEAIASYPVIIKEIKLALQQCSRKLASFLSGKRREYQQQRRIQIFQRYAPEIEEALSKLTGRPQNEIKKHIDAMLEERLKKKALQEEEGQETGEKPVEESPEAGEAQEESGENAE